MVDFWRNLFNTESYPPRWGCGQWTAGEGWLHIGADVAVWGAYTTIPIVLVYFVLQRKDVPLPKIFWLFAAFILSCGFAHLLDATMFWWPAYRLSGIAKLVTAVVSWTAVIALIQVTPIALRWPGLAVVNAKLERANDDLNEFAHIVSHDLRAPLRSIRQLTQWIREDAQKSPEALEKHLSLLEEKAARLDGLVAGILQYSSASRSEDGDVVERKALEEIVQGALELIDVPPGISVKVETALPVMECSPIQMEQVFLNLIHNAVKYMGKDEGSICIGVEDRGRYWDLYVADTGIGIAPVYHDQVFRIFQTIEPREGGQIGGIGLAVVKRIVEGHGGQIWVESEPGAGSKFVMRLPKVRIQLKSA